jgi:hypothetical protein
MYKSEVVVSRWIKGFINFTLRLLSQLSAAFGKPLIKVVE